MRGLKAKASAAKRQETEKGVATARGPIDWRQCALLRPVAAVCRPASRQGKSPRGDREMSFFFRMASRLRPSTPEEVVRSIKDSFLALNTRTHTKVIYPISPPPLPLLLASPPASPPVLAPFLWRSRDRSIHARPVLDRPRWRNRMQSCDLGGGWCPVSLVISRSWSFGSPSVPWGIISFLFFITTRSSDRLWYSLWLKWDNAESLNPSSWCLNEPENTD